MLCPDCGVETEDLVEGSCARCFVRRHDIAELPAHVDLLLCATCFARRDGETWTDPGENSRMDMVDQAVVRSVKFHPLVKDTHVEIMSQPQDDMNHAYDVMVDGNVEGLPVDALYQTVARIKQGVCTACSRQAGGYFAAIIQLRASGRDPTDEERQEGGALVMRTVDRLRTNGNQNAFVTKQGMVKGGHDFFISEIDVGRIAARKLADRFDARVEEAPKLVGRKAGTDVYRVTFLVRLPPYRTGDYVDVGQGVCRVEQVASKTISLRRLKDGRQTSVPRDRIRPSDVVATQADTKEMMVVSVVRDEALLLDPDTNKTHEVLLPEGLQYDLSIRVFDVVEHDDQVYFVGIPRKGGLPVL